MVWYTDKHTDVQTLTYTDRETDSSPQIFIAPETNVLEPNGMRGCMLYRVRLPVLRTIINLNVRQKLF
jgi:hypothetical protein